MCFTKHQKSHVDSANPRHQAVINLRHRATFAHIKTQYDMHATHIQWQHQRRRRPLTTHDAYSRAPMVASEILELFLVCITKPQKSHVDSANPRHQQVINLGPCIAHAVPAPAPQSATNCTGCLLTRSEGSLRNSRAISDVHHQTSEISCGFCQSSAPIRKQPSVRIAPAPDIVRHTWIARPATAPRLPAAMNRTGDAYTHPMQPQQF